MIAILALIPVIIFYVVAIYLFVKLCRDVSKIKVQIDKGTDWSDEYRKYRFFNNHEEAIKAAKNYIWVLHSQDYSDLSERQANYDWLNANIKPYFEEQGQEWPDLKI